MRRGKKRVNAIGLLVLGWAITAVYSAFGGFSAAPHSAQASMDPGVFAPVTINASRIMAVSKWQVEKGSALYIVPPRRTTPVKRLAKRI